MVDETGPHNDAEHLLRVRRDVVSNETRSPTSDRQQQLDNDDTSFYDNDNNIDYYNTVYDNHDDDETYNDHYQLYDTQPAPHYNKVCIA